MEATATLRPKLKQDSTFLSSRGGVLFRNGKTVFFLKGESIYEWISSVAPRLTGELTLDELCSDLTPERRQSVVSLINTLADKGIIINHEPEPGGELPAAVLEQFSAQTELIGHYTGRALGRFARWRASRVMLTGSGLPLRALAAALVKNGLESLFVAPEVGSEVSLPEAEQEIERLSKAGVRATLKVVERPGRASADVLDRFDLVVYCSDRPEWRTLIELNALCFERRRSLLPALLVGDKSVLGPLVRPPAPGCFLCGLMRLSANMTEQEHADLWKALASGGGPAGPAAGCAVASHMLGNNAAYELFKTLTGYLTPESLSGLLVQELSTLEAARGPLLPHPLCPVCSAADYEGAKRRLVETTESAAEDETPDEQLWRRCRALIDPRVGLFAGFEDEAHTQLPLRVSRLNVTHPVAAGGRPSAVFAYGLESSLEARQNALREGVRRYASQASGTRRMLTASADEMQERGLMPVRPEHIYTWAGTYAPDGLEPLEWLPALSVTSGRLRHVPAAAVYNSSPLDRDGIFEQTDAGHGLGPSFSASLFDGLTSALRYMQLRDLLRGAATLHAIADPQAFGAGSRDLAYLWTSARRLGYDVQLFALGSDWPTRVVVAAAAEAQTGAARQYGFGSGFDGLAAAIHALTNLVGVFQLRQAGPDVPNPAEAFCPNFRLPPAAPTAWLEAADESERGSSQAELVASVEERGCQVLYAETTPEDIRATRTFITGKVLLAHRRGRVLVFSHDET